MSLILWKTTVCLSSIIEQILGVFTINVLAVRERHFHEDSIFKLFSKYFPSCSLVEFRENQKVVLLFYLDKEPCADADLFKEEELYLG